MSPGRRVRPRACPAKRRVGFPQVRDEQLVDAGRARRRIEVREREAVRERQRSMGSVGHEGESERQRRIS